MMFLQIERKSIYFYEIKIKTINLNDPEIILIDIANVFVISNDNVNIDNVFTKIGKS